MCRGLGRAEFHEGRWVYWGRNVDSLAIAQSCAQIIADALLTIGLVAFGLVGLVLLITVLQERWVAAIPPWEVVWQARGDVRLFLLFLSLGTNLFLIFRILRKSELKGLVPRRGEEGSAAPTPSLELAELKHRPVDERFDIATALTAEAGRSVEEAWQLAERFRSEGVAAPFLFAALFGFRKIAAMRARLGVNDQKLMELLRKILGSYTQPKTTVPILGNEFRSVMMAAFRRAKDRRARQIDVTDMMAAATGQSEEVRDLFDELGITLPMVENVVAWITIQEDLRRQWQHLRSRARFKPKGVMNRAMTAIATPLLDRFSNDLTALARAGYLHPCIAREHELDEIFQLIEGGKNVLLVGNPGVGKTSIIEGIAQRMVTEDVPKVLQDKRLVSLSIAAIVGSGGAFGGLEQRLTLILHEVARAGNIVLFFDNIQNLVGVSSAGGATLDLSEMVSASLAGRSIVALATTNPIDYRRYVEPSSGLSSAFTTMMIEEVEPNAAIQILEGKAGTVEYEHRVYFSYAALDRIVALAKRYLHDRYLPEKAWSLMEEVAVFVHRQRGAKALVTAEDVAQVVSEKTSIALTEVTQEESARLLQLEDRIHERIVGQDEAVTAVASALRRARVELRDVSRPIVNLLFLGPTGVGKTELAKTVARVYFGAEENMIRLDMSEYQEPQSVNLLLGAPPGYSGAAGGGYLTEAVRHQPFSLILLDELEKAHPDILNVFLQVMDDGRLSDGAGRTIDFTNVILIATSNAGTEVIQEELRQRVSLEAIKTQLLEHELGRYFRPEFLNRFDQIVVFRPLTKTEIVNVAKLQLAEVAERLAKKGITLEATEAAVRELAEIGYDELFGARPLRRLIQDRVDDALAKYLLTGRLSRRDRAVLEPGGRIRVVEAPAVWERHHTQAS